MESLKILLLKREEVLENLHSINSKFEDNMTVSESNPIYDEKCIEEKRLKEIQLDVMKIIISKDKFEYIRIDWGKLMRERYNQTLELTGEGQRISDGPE